MEHVNATVVTINPPAPFARSRVEWLAGLLKIQAFRERPFTPPWWGDGAETLVRLHAGEVDAPHVAVALNLRGLDVEVVRMVRLLERVSQRTAIRALGLCALVACKDLGLHEGRAAIDDDMGEAAEARALDLLAAFEAGDERALRSIEGGGTGTPADAMLSRLARYAREGRVGADVHRWVLDAAASQALPHAQRWTLTGVYDALMECAEALDSDRGLGDDEIDQLARFLMTGDAD